ncbi:hypothetical protein ACFYNO_33395 [Kitasatospora sp. NPDC006697]|uniref:hypothetical protein n=1 Tax=Kitasatospora sp. NPDC006697 TaxID=3364020 RepID=UPI003674E11F
MTQPSTADAVIPAQRTAAARPAAPAATVRAAEPARQSGWAALRRGFAALRGLRSLGTVPAGPQPGYGEVDGQ